MATGDFQSHWIEWVLLSSIGPASGDVVYEVFNQSSMIGSFLQRLSTDGIEKGLVDASIDWITMQTLKMFNAFQW